MKRTSRLSFLALLVAFLFAVGCTPYDDDDCADDCGGDDDDIIDDDDDSAAS